MTWRQLRLLQRDGFDIGSHTVSHADLVDRGIGPGPHPASRVTVRASSATSTTRFNGSPTRTGWSTLPSNGSRSRAGYVLAVTTSSGLVQDADAPLLLHRFEVTDTTGVRASRHCSRTSSSARSGRRTR